MRELARNHPTVASPDVVYILSPFIRRHGPPTSSHLLAGAFLTFLPTTPFHDFTGSPSPSTRVNSTERPLDSDNSLDVHDDARVNLVNPDSRYQSRIYLGGASTG
jgi:hypothetical protein